MSLGIGLSQRGIKIFGFFFRKFAKVVKHLTGKSRTAGALGRWATEGRTEHGLETYGSRGILALHGCKSETEAEKHRNKNVFVYEDGFVTNEKSPAHGRLEERYDSRFCVLGGGSGNGRGCESLR